MPFSDAPRQARPTPLDAHTDPIRPAPAQQRGFGQWIISNMKDVRQVLTAPTTSADQVTPKAVKRASGSQRESMNRLLTIFRVVNRAHRTPNDDERAAAIAITRKLMEGLLDLDFAHHLGGNVFARTGVLDAAGDVIDPLVRAWRAFSLGIDEDLGQSIEDRLIEIMLRLERLNDADLTELEDLASRTLQDMDHLCTESPVAGEIAVTHWISPAFLALMPMRLTSVSMLEYLASDPATQERLRADPSLRPAYIHEIERLAGAFRYVVRQIGPQGLDLEHVRLPPRNIVILDLSAANRDPAIWDFPDDLRLDRPRQATASFSFGPLACTGAATSRQFLEKLLDSVLANCRVSAPASGQGGRSVPCAWPVLRGHSRSYLVFEAL